jgi:hypothetical protein
MLGSSLNFLGAILLPSSSSWSLVTERKKWNGGGMD